MDPNNLEECWFFGNLLEIKSKSKSKSRMVRSLSDPCSSSSGKSYEETYESIKKLESRRRSSSNRKSSSSSKKKKSGLARAPSLPTSLDSQDEEEEEEEVEFSMGKLIRQASLNTRPPPQIASNKASRSLNRSEVEEVQQGIKDLGLMEKEINVVERRAPPVPRWGGKRAPDEMKAQIKFWARAVASNVRQEC